VLEAVIGVFKLTSNAQAEPHGSRRSTLIELPA
jgi:hypothetical protein